MLQDRGRATVVVLVDLELSLPPALMSTVGGGGGGVRTQKKEMVVGRFVLLLSLKMLQLPLKKKF